MTLLLNCIVVFVILVSAGCDTLKLPAVPEGTALSYGMVVDIPNGFEVPEGCWQRDPDNRPQEYRCDEIPKGWQLTSPEGYSILKSDIDAKYAELAKLRRRCGD